jgi:hypothetical protein
MFVRMGRRSWAVPALIIIGVLLFLLCLSTGSVPIPLRDVISALLSSAQGRNLGDDRARGAPA